MVLASINDSNLTVYKVSKLFLRKRGYKYNCLNNWFLGMQMFKASLIIFRKIVKGSNMLVIYAVNETSYFLC